MAGVFCAVNAAENFAFSFDTMADDSCFAMFASRSQHVDRAFEAVKGVLGATDHDFECLVVIIAAILTSHIDLPLTIVTLSIDRVSGH